MRLILKHTFKDIWAHKLRTILLVICIIVCSFTAMLCFDMNGSLGIMIRGVYSSMIGGADLYVQSKSPLEENFADGIDESDVIRMAVYSSYFDRHLDMDCSYVRRKDMNIFALEPEQAAKMALLRKDINLSGKKAAVTDEFAGEFGYKVGDTITLHGDRDKPVDFTIGYIEKKQGIFNNGNVIVIDLDDSAELALSNTVEAYNAFIDVKDDSKIKDAEKTLKANLPGVEIENFMDDKSIQDSIKSISKLFFVLFAICMLLVVFVTVSISERMITDKMSVVGTFRSLGISTGKTTLALILENALYGAVGSLIGVGVYVLIKQPFFNVMFTFGGADGEVLHPDVPMSKPYVIAGVILGAILIECFCPVKEVIKAIKTPIRDIIFDTKDTEYHAGRVTTILGILLFAVSAVTFFFKDSFSLNIICFVSFIGGAALLFNYLERGVAKLVSLIFDKLNFPIAKLAAIEAGAKKNTVGSSILCLTAAALALVLYTYASSMSSFYDKLVMDGDVIAMSGTCKGDLLSYISELDGVEKAEFVYFIPNEIKIDGKSETCYVYGYPEGGNELFIALEGIEENLGAEEIAMDRIMMQKLGYSIGDSVNIIFDSEGYMPIEKTLKIAQPITVDYNTASGTSIALNLDTYKEIYKDYPMDILVKGDDANALKKTIQDHSSDYILQIYTKKEFDVLMTAQKASITAILNILILIGVGLTFIGIVSNQLIGLEGRKRECAVMASVAMPMKKLKRMFLIENFTSSAIALITAVPVGVFMSKIFVRIMEQLQIAIPIVVSTGRCAGYAVFLLVVFTFVSLFPIRALKKMDMVTQLKYE